MYLEVEEVSMLLSQWSTTVFYAGNFHFDNMCAEVVVIIQVCDKV